MVLVHPDVFAGAQSAHEAVVDAAEQFLLLVRDADDGELWEAVEVVDDAGVLELIDPSATARISQRSVSRPLWSFAATRAAPSMTLAVVVTVPPRTSCWWLWS
jgi:hypothetical protein